MKVIKKGADEMQWIITKTDDSIAEQKMGENIFVGVLCVVALAAGIWGWWIQTVTFGIVGQWALTLQHKELCVTGSLC